MRVLLCEDDIQQRQFLQTVISKYIQNDESNIELVLSASKPEEVLSYIEHHKVDCYFLDIELGATMNGLELARVIREKNPLALIIFITTYADKLKLTFTYKIAALDFILKDEPALEQKIVEALRDAYDKFQRLYLSDESGYFVLKIGELIKKVLYDDIYYFETSTHSHKVILREKHGFYEFFGSLKEVSEQLDERFFRCHRSYIINIHQIQQLDLKKRKIVMKNGLPCDVSFQHWRTVKQHFFAYQSGE